MVVNFVLTLFILTIFIVILTKSNIRFLNIYSKPKETFVCIAVLIKLIELQCIIIIIKYNRAPWHTSIVDVDERLVKIKNINEANSFTFKDFQNILLCQSALIFVQIFRTIVRKNVNHTLDFRHIGIHELYSQFCCRNYIATRG